MTGESHVTHRHTMPFTYIWKVFSNIKYCKITITRGTVKIDYLTVSILIEYPKHITDTTLRSFSTY